MSIQDRAKEFVDQHVKTLPIAVRLSGITEAEKKEAASLCADFAEIAVREFVEKFNVELLRLALEVNPPRSWEFNDQAFRAAFREMFGKSLDG